MFPFPVLFLTTNSGGIVPLPEGIVKKVVATESTVSSFRNSVAVLLTDGRLFTQGINAYGELADGTTNANYTSWHLADTTVDDVFNGDATFIIKRTDGSWKFVGNQSGLTGSGSPKTTWTDLPATITGTFSMANVVNITGAIGNTLYLLNNGALYGSGTNANGCLGAGNNNVFPTPRLISTGVKKMYSLTSNVSYLTSSGILRVCGLTWGIGGGTTASQTTTFISAVFTGTGDTVFVKDYSTTPYQTMVIGAASETSPTSYLYARGFTNADYRKITAYSAGFPSGEFPLGTGGSHLIIGTDFLAAGSNTSGLLGTGNTANAFTPLVPTYPFNDAGWDIDLVQHIAVANLSNNGANGANFMVYNNNLYITGASLLNGGALSANVFTNISQFNT